MKHFIGDFSEKTLKSIKKAGIFRGKDGFSFILTCKYGIIKLNLIGFELVSQNRTKGEIPSFLTEGMMIIDMGKIISVANQKGGVGKTTTIVNLAAGLGQSGKKCLLVDMDAQGNSTSGLGINRRELEVSTYDLMTGEARASEAVIKTEFKKLDIIPSSIDLAAAEIELAEEDGRNLKLRQALAAIQDQYDYILIDCPPSLGLITLNAFAASDSVIVPLQCEYYALEGLSQLIATIRQVKRFYNPEIELEGILMTMYDGRLKLTHQVEDEIKSHFPGQVYETVIPRNVRLSEAPSFGTPAIYFDRSSRGSKAYLALTKEILKMHRKKKKQEVEENGEK